MFLIQHSNRVLLPFIYVRNGYVLNVRSGLVVSYHYLYLNVRFQYKADIRFDCSERLLSSESGHKGVVLETAKLFSIRCK